MNEKLVMIDISEIYPNKDNPRKDIGDIEELTKSIEKNGLMQNLTVVPGHWKNDLAYTNGYTLLIGHRRYAAAKAAGLTEVPCRIVTGMDKKEQVSTMLEENMQRADLNVYEQAAGFQMMMDLGETEDGLVEKTGFSKRTIQHRLNLAKLDKDVLKDKVESEEFQLSLTDMYELEKIKSVEKRNDVLKRARTSKELVWMSHSAVDEEKVDEQYDIFVKWCEELGLKEAPEDVQKSYWGEYDVVFSFNLKDEIEKPEEFDDEVDDECLYFKTYNWAKVIKPCEVIDEDNDDNESVKQAQKRINANREEFDDINLNFEERLRKFILEVIGGYIDDIKPDMEYYELVFNALISAQVGMSLDSMILFMTDKGVWELTEDEKAQARAKIESLPIHHRMLLMLGHVTNFDDLRTWQGEYDEDIATALELIFDVFNKWGFTLWSEEQALLDGTSILYENVAREVVVKGLMDDGYCPYCDTLLLDHTDVEHCPECGQKLTWNHWHNCNDD